MYPQLKFLKLQLPLGDLSKLKFLITRIHSELFQHGGEFPMSDLLSPSLGFLLQAKPMLKPCAAWKNIMFLT